MPNHKPSPCLLVIFGASGDLTKRKLVPALYDLDAAGQLPSGFAVVGISRTEMADEVFRDHLHDPAKEFAHDFSESKWEQFARRIHYHAADSTRPEAYPAIKRCLDDLARQHHTGCNLLFYLSVAPQLYQPIIENLGHSGLITEGKRWCSLDRGNPPWQRIIIEKPFGFDLESARDLNRTLGRVLEEESIYRIDHYLGKETVQNLLVFRFANAIFEPVWNRTYIDHVEVTAAETVGVEGRGGYYDSPSGGALRDMVQSHLLQLMTLVAMEPPVSMRADDIRMEKLKILSALRTPTPDDVPQIAVRGQYGPGKIKGQNVPGYREEPGVKPDSQTETYAALQLFVDTWRWSGVPFYLRSGKRLPRKLTQLVIQFKPTPHCLFREQVRCAGGIPPNQIVINVQPDEGIRLRFEGKVPGTSGGGGSGMHLKPVIMDFDYVKQFGVEPPEAYATLLLDAMRGDQTLYKHRDEVEQSWRVAQPVLDYWHAHPTPDLPNYPAGAWGPPAADALLTRDGRHWHNT